VGCASAIVYVVAHEALGVGAHETHDAAVLSPCILYTQTQGARGSMIRCSAINLPSACVIGRRKAWSYGTRPCSKLAICDHSDLQTHIHYMRIISARTLHTYPIISSLYILDTQQYFPRAFFTAFPNEHVHLLHAANVRLHFTYKIRRTTYIDVTRPCCQLTFNNANHSEPLHP